MPRLQKVRNKILLILGIDLSFTGTGLVMLDDGKLIGQSLIKTVLEGKLIHERMSRVEKTLGGIIEFSQGFFSNKQRDNVIVVIEGYSFGSKHGKAFSIGELGGIIRYWIRNNFCHENILEIPPKRLKKFITGNGNADKELMIKSVYKQYKFKTDSDDIADAFGLAYMAWAKYNIQNKLDNKIIINLNQKAIIKDMINCQ